MDNMGYMHQGPPPAVNNGYKHLQETTVEMQQTNPYPNPPAPLYQSPYQVDVYAPPTNVVTVQEGPDPPQTAQYIDHNLAISLVSLFFCCFIGVFAVNISSKASDAQQSGDYNSALMFSRKARKLAMAAIITAIVLSILGLASAVIVPLAFALSNSNSYTEVDSYSSYQSN